MIKSNFHNFDIIGVNFFSKQLKTARKRKDRKKIQKAIKVLLGMRSKNVNR